MPFFKYKAKNEKGAAVSGLVEAKKEQEAAALLRERGLFVFSLKEEKKGANPLKAFSLGFKKVSFSEIVNFTRQLSTMITAGIPLVESLTILRSQGKNSPMASVIAEMIEEIEGGGTLTSALGRHPECFSKIYVSLIRAGEAGGMLDQVLVRLADNLEKEREFQGKVKGAMIYPAIVIIGMFGVMFVMMTMVVPKLMPLYKEFGVSLPLPTKILMFLSDFFVGFWWLILGAMIGLFAAFKIFKKTEMGSRIFDSLILRLPVWGNVKKQVILVEFTRTLGLLIGAGLPILEALNIVADSLDNLIYREGIKEAARTVEKGFSLGVPLSQNPNFPAILGQMTKVGEETGKMDETLLKLSAYFESESEQTVRGLTSAMEPLIMIVLGIGVGFLILATIIPIYSLVGQF